MRYTYSCAVRFDDLDSYGHVNNVTFAEYVQEARVAFAHVVIDGAVQDEGWVVARQEIEYLQPVSFRAEPLLVHLWVTEIGTSSFITAYEVRDDSVVYATARTVLVAVDPTTQGSRPLSASETAALEPYRELS